MSFGNVEYLMSALVLDYVLEVGNSLSGKTRAVYELLKKQDFADYNIIYPNSANYQNIETHNPEVDGSSPSPAIKCKKGCLLVPFFV